MSQMVDISGLDNSECRWQRVAEYLQLSDVIITLYDNRAHKSEWKVSVKMVMSLNLRLYLHFCMMS